MAIEIRDDRTARAREELERLRLRLLDLSGRNRFLNFRHSETSRTQLRLANTSIEALESAISIGQDMQVRGLRKPVDAEPVTVDITEDESEDSTEAAKLLTPLRRVRRFDAQLMARVASSTGINPSFELPVDGVVSKARDLQALLFMEDLERRLQGIYDEERRYLQELGISTLYLCLGFLEWYEAEHSDKARLAPLILYPIEIKRVLTGAKYAFSIRGVGDDPESNISLIERLNRDFGIRLPEFDGESQSATDYFDIISDSVKEQPRWTVRTFATIAILNFAKLAMYKDLDPDARSEDCKLESNAVIVDVLSGTEANSDASSLQMEDDDLKPTSSVPLLVTEADSSQYAAIAQALVPQSLVIEGPPGTGKSQTITNIIAGALANGLRVLFVAEKLAALQVVKSKMDAYGLGPYCLELHSTKARKIDVYKSIGERLYGGKPKSPNIDGLLSDIEQQKSILDRYVATLHGVHGKLELSIHELLWKEQRLRLELGKDAAGVEHIHISGAEEYGAGGLAQSCQVLDGFEATSKGISDSYGSCSSHPWFGFTDADADLECRRTALQELLSSQSVFSAFQKACSAFSSSLSFRSALTTKDWTHLCELSCALAGHDPLVPAYIVRRLRESRACEVVQRLAANLTQVKTLENTYGASLLQKLLQAEDTYHSLDALASGTYANVSIQALSRAISDIGEEIGGLTDLVQFASELSHFTGEPSHDGMRIAKQASDLLENTGRQVLLGRLVSLTDESTAYAISSACAAGKELRSRYQAAGMAYDLEGIPDVGTLREYARALRNAPMFWWFDGSVRLAHKAYRLHATEKRKRTNLEVASALVDLADLLSAVEAFRNDSHVREVLQDAFNGLETDFDGLLSVISFNEAVRQITGSGSAASRSIRASMLNGSIDDLDRFVALMRDERSAFLEESIGSGLWLRIEQQIKSLNAERDLLQRLDAQVRMDGVPPMTIAALFEAVGAAQARRDLRLKIEGDGAAKEVLHEVFVGRETNTGRLDAALKYAELLNSSTLPKAVLDFIASREAADLRHAVDQLRPVWIDCKGALAVALQALCNSRYLDSADFFGNPDVSELETSAVTGRLALALGRAETLEDWVRYLHLRKRAIGAAGSQLIFYFEGGGISGKTSLADIFEYLVVRSIVRAAIDKYPPLRDFPGMSLQSARERFRDLDKRVIETHRGVLAAKLHANRIDPGNSSGARGTWTGLSLLQNEVNKQKRHIAIRDAVQRAGAALQQIKPCFMMSPLSVAQYIPPGSIEFDLIVIDEASQMKPEDALGALSRGHDVVVVGDPKQLPPTSFFERQFESDEVADEDAVDNESILDLAISQYGKRRLRWHYRSKHESLIAFSNHHFYENDLIVFPSPAEAGAESGVRSHYVAGAYKNGTNPDEAKAVSEAAIRFMKNSPHLSLGIVAINREQRELINDEITRMVAGDPHASEYVGKWDGSLFPFFVKNLESVQGDERDVIFISTVYGPEEPGRPVAQRFGPILGPTGWRRLNVLFTRARVRVELFTSMMPADIRIDERSSRGVIALREYLDYAQTGRLESGKLSRRPPDSDFEIAVARLLENAGFEVDPQVGVAHYYIDLAVRHPRNGSYLLGIECDGATYHSAKSARDRDRTREEALKALGWSLYRIWSTDWFADPRREFAKLESFLKELVAYS